MICVVIKGPTLIETHQQISEALAYADIVELRLDGFLELDVEALKILRSHFSIPMIFTLRSQQQGGHYTQSEENRLTDIRRLAVLKPEYLDLENHVPSDFIEELSLQYPQIKLILSYHNFTETPENLEGIFQEMQKTPASFYKIAVTAQNCLDAMRLLCWTKNSPKKLIAISMGSHGQISRILAPVMECPITYVSLDENQKSAPGQLSAKTLIEQYHYHSLNPCTALYGLIGDPVDLSISDETHNAFMAACDLDAVYVKIQVKAFELSAFLQYAKRLPFHGLSVTMPLKELVMPFLDEVAPQALAIGAVNTLLFEEDRIFGCNTDGIGALNAIERECQVHDKRIVIIGAGGASKAIAFEAQRRGGLVTIINRNAEKALQIAQSLSCVGQGLDYMPTCSKEGYDILINCTPVSPPSIFNEMLPQAIAMDIVTNPKETEFLKNATAKGCRIIYGYRMFIEQALGQFNFWFKDIDMVESRKILEKKALDILEN